MEPRSDSAQPSISEGISRALGHLIRSKSATFTCGGSIPVVRETRESTYHSLF
jgi:hypothetical protein